MRYKITNNIGEVIKTECGIWDLLPEGDRIRIGDCWSSSPYLRTWDFPPGNTNVVQPTQQIYRSREHGSKPHMAPQSDMSIREYRQVYSSRAEYAIIEINGAVCQPLRKGIPQKGDITSVAGKWRVLLYDWGHGVSRKDKVYRRGFEGFRCLCGYESKNGRCLNATTLNEQPPFSIHKSEHINPYFEQKKVESMQTQKKFWIVKRRPKAGAEVVPGERYQNAMYSSLQKAKCRARELAQSGGDGFLVLEVVDCYDIANVSQVPVV